MKFLLNINILFLLLMSTPYGMAQAFAETPHELSYELHEECQEIFNKILYSKIDIELIETYRIIKTGELQFDYKTVFSNLKRTYMLASNSLCNRGRIHTTDVRDINYRCMIEKISNSLRHLQKLNKIIDAVHNNEDAERSSMLIKEMLVYYFENYYVDFETFCNIPPLPFFEANMEKYARGLIDDIVSAIDHVLTEFPSYRHVKPSIKITEKKMMYIEEADKERLLSAISYIRQDKLAMALNVLEYRKYFDDDSARLHYILGDIYNLEGAQKNALVEYEIVTRAAPENYMAWFHKANILSSIGRKKEAISCYEEVIDYAPDFYAAWFRLANTLNEMGRKEEALDNFTAASNIKPDFYPPWYYRGILHKERQEYKDAVNCFKRVLKLNPYHTHSYNNIINIYKRENRLKDMIQEYKEMVKFKDEFILHNLLGAAYLNMEYSEQAISEFKKAIDIEPNVVSYNFLGLIYQSMADYSNAIKEFNNAVLLDHGFAEGYYNLGIAYELNQRGKRYGPGFKMKEAVNSFEKAIHIDSRFTIAYNRLGLLYLNTGAIDKAITQFKTAIKVDPFYIESFNNLISAYKKRSIANDELDSFSLKDNDLASELASHNLTGLLYQIQGSFNRAIEEYKKAIRINPNPVSHNFLGNIYLMREDADMAVEEYGKLIKINPHIAQTNYNLGLAYFRKGDHKRAVEYLDKAIEIKADYSMAYYISGVIFKHRFFTSNRVEDLDKAVYLLEKALEIDPYMDEALTTLVTLHKSSGRLYTQIKKYKGLIAQKPTAALYNQLGFAYQLIGREDSALIQYKKAVNIAPNHVSYNYMGVLYEKFMDIDNAIVSYTRAALIYPNVTSYLRLGNIYADILEFNMAIQQYKNAINLDTANIQARLQFASLYEYNKDGVRYGRGFNAQEAVRQYKKALVIKPDFAGIHYRMGLIYEYNKDGVRYGRGFNAQEAVRQYKKALVIKPDFSMALSSLKKLYRKMDDTESLAGIEKWITDQFADRQKKNKDINTEGHSTTDIELRDEDIAARYYFLGMTSQDAGDFDDAIEQYERAIHKNTELIDAYYNLGALYRKKGMLEKAFGIYTGAASIGPDTEEEAYNNIGLIYGDVRAYRLAIEHFKKAIAADPGFAEAYSNLVMIYEKMGDREKAKEMYAKYDSLVRGEY